MRASLSLGARDAARVADTHHAFWRRACAVAIDLLVLSVVNAIVQAVFGVTVVTSGSPVPAVGAGLAAFTSTTVVGWGWAWLYGPVYFIALEALFGATLGKWALRVRVTNLAGQRPAVLQIVVRNVVRIVDAFPFLYLVGGGVALLSPLRQRLGDHLASTLVVPDETLVAPRLPLAVVRWRLALVGGVLLALIAFTGAFWYFGRPPLVVQSMINTRQAMFQDGVSAYTLGAPTWGNGTVTYQIDYRTLSPVDTCHARLTLTWTPLGGWVDRGGQATCAAHTP